METKTRKTGRVSTALVCGISVVSALAFVMIVAVPGCGILFPTPTPTATATPTPTPTPECTVDADCAEGEVCSNGVCEAGPTAEPECVEDLDCDDADDCTDDACVDGACANTANTAACDDGDACTENDVCASGDCAGTALVCDEGLECVDGECVEPPTECETDDDCADGEVCTNGVCEAAPCEGDEDCDEGFVCSNGVCEEEEVTACDTDADCDDGLFCTGVEVCTNSVCVAGTDPCAETVCACGDPICSEADTEAECSCPACPTIDFTLSQDNLTGTAGDDVFNAPLLFAEGAGAQASSLQTGDKANGLAGDDELYATLIGGANPVVQLTGIESLFFTNYAAETINASNIGGATLIGWVNSTANLTANTLPNIVAAYIEGMATAATTFHLSFQAGASTSPTTGATDAMNLEVVTTTQGTFQVTTAANGFEILNVESTGGTANTLTAITQTTGTTMATANFAGDTDLSIATIPNTVLTIVGTSLTGGLQLGTGTTAATYTGFASIANNLTDLDTGTGNDTVIFGTQFNTNDFSSATVDLGTGTDIVEAIFASDYGTSMPFRNVDEFRFNCTTAATVNMTGITGLTKVTNDSDGTATAITLQNLPATSSVYPTLTFRGDNTQAAQTYDTLTYQATGNTGSSDAVAIDVNNRGTALNSGSGTTNVHTMGAITAAGFETVTVDVADGPATFGGITASTMTTFDLDTGTNVPATGTVTLGTVAPTTAVLVTADCSGANANVNATFDYLASGAVITTAGGNDTIVAGTNSTGTTLSVTLGAGNDSFTGDTNTDCADSVNAGAGSDIIDAYGGNDTITTSDGADTVIFRQSTADDREDISDFTLGAGGDVMKFDQSDIVLVGVTEYVGAVAGVTGEYIVAVTDAGYATDLLAETAVNVTGTLGDGVNLIILYFNTADSTVHIVFDTDADTDAGPVLIGKLTNVTTLVSWATVTTANLDNQS